MCQARFFEKFGSLFVFFHRLVELIKGFINIGLGDMCSCQSADVIRCTSLGQCPIETDDGGSMVAFVHVDAPFVIERTQLIVGCSVVLVIVDGRLQHLEVGTVDVVLVHCHGKQQGVLRLFFVVGKVFRPDAL